MYDIAPPVAASLFRAAFSPDSKTLALEIDQTLFLIDPATGLPRMPPISLSLLCRRTEELIFTPDGARLIVLGDIVPQQILIPIDVASGQLGTIVRLRSFGFRDPPRWSPDGRWLLLNSYDGQFLFDATTLTPHASQPPPRKQFTFSPDFARAAVIAGPGRVEIVETKGWQTLSTIDVPLPPSGRARQVVAATFAGDGEHLLTSTNGDLNVWRRRRPEAEWGIIALPQCWAVIVLGMALFLSAARDLLRFVSPAPEPAVPAAA
jgi:hypothetical protein